MDVKDVAAKLKQGQIKYRPELLKDLYLFMCVYSSNKTLQNELIKINNANNQTFKTNYSLHDIDGQRILYIRKLNIPGYLKAGKTLSNILFSVDTKSFWGLLLSNQCLADVNAPYRIFLLDATADMTKKYSEISKIKSKNKRNYNDFKLNETILDYSSGSRAIGFMLDNTGRLFVDVYADYKFPYDDSGIYCSFKADLNVTAADFAKILVKAADPETKTLSIKDHIDPIVNVKRNILFRKLEKA